MAKSVGTYNKVTRKRKGVHSKNASRQGKPGGQCNSKSRTNKKSRGQG